MKTCLDDSLGRPGEVRECAERPGECRLPLGCIEARARFSRPTEQHFLGKCDAELAVSMPEEMKADFAAVAAIQKTTPTELARRVLSDFLYGRLAQVQRIVSR